MSKQLQLIVPGGGLSKSEWDKVVDLKLKRWWEWPHYFSAEQPEPLKPIVNQVYTAEGNNFSQTFKVVEIYVIESTSTTYVDVLWYVNGDWVRV